MNVHRFAIAVVAMLCGVCSAVRPAAASPGAGLLITNVATATYRDGAGHALAASSNEVSVAVAAVSAASLGSGANACGTTANPFAIGPVAALRFTVVNTSNVADAYRIISVGATSGTVDGLAFLGPQPIDATVGSTISPTVAPGGSIVVAVSLATGGIAPGTAFQITLVVRTTNAATANGLQTVRATACGVAERGATIGSPVPAQTGPPVKLVDGLPSIAATSGTAVRYTIGYMNHGGMPANGVVLTDPVPAGIVPQANSATIDGRAAGAAASVDASGTLRIALGTVAPGPAHVVAFTAIVNAAAPGTSLVNVANFSATNAPAVASTTATVVTGVADVVFDGASGAAVSGATLSLVPAGGTSPAELSGMPVPPNANDANPFVTGASGAYGFGLAPAQTGAGRFALQVSAPGYKSRRFPLLLAPDAGGATYDVTVTASDGAPLALPGTLTLTHAASVKLADAYGIFGNLPLFKPESIAISKNVDRTQASGGDRLVYTIAIASAADPLGATTVVDRLPRDVLYARGTARVDGVHVEPVAAGASLTWTFPSLAAQHTIVFATVVAPGAVEGAALVNVATGTSVLPGTGAGTTTANASATTYVVGGVLSDRSIILGRVFVDYFGDGRFHKGDLGVAKARVFLEDGESVQTDADGLFSFPSVRPGMHALHLDPDSLPRALEPFETRDYDDPRSPIRLVHGPFDGGLLSDVQFAVKLK